MGKQAMTDIVRVLGAADLLAEIVAASRVGYGDPVTRSNYPASLFHRAVAMLAASPQEAAPTKREAALAELAKLDGETMDLAASPQGGGLQRRVDLNNGGTLEAGGHVDDLSISGEYISLLRLERMNRGSFWGRIYMKDGKDIVLSISAPKGKIDVTAEADQGLPLSPQGEGSSAEWITHDGGPNPVPGKMVDLMFAPDNWCRAGLSDAYNWKRGRGAGIDIIAYRVTEGVKP